MIVSVDVYTKDIEAGLSAFKSALEAGATDVNLRSYEDYETKEFENLNLSCRKMMFRAYDSSVPCFSTTYSSEIKSYRRDVVRRVL